MADSYDIVDGQVISFHGGRRDTDTDTWRDATPLELQLQEQVQELETENASLREDAELWRKHMGSLAVLHSILDAASPLVLNKLKAEDAARDAKR